MLTNDQSQDVNAQVNFPTVRPENIPSAGISLPSEDEKPVTVWNPIGWKPEETLPPHLQRYSGSARHFVGGILHEQIFDKTLRGEFVPRKASYARKFFPNKNAFTEAKNALVACGDLDCDGQYIEGVKSMGYRLGPTLAVATIQRYPITDAKLARKIKANRDDWKTTAEGVHRHLAYWLPRFDFDYESAVDELLTKETVSPSELAILEMIRDKEFNLRVCPYGRFHSSLTNLNGELRKHLSYQGETLFNIDIRNSQPLFFALVLKDHFRGTSTPDDVEEYICLCEAGLFYDVLMERAGIPNGVRSKFKQSFFACVMFCDADPVKPHAAIFAEQFPCVYQAIRAEKAGDYRALAHKLQRAESSLMIGKICVRIMKEGAGACLATIHDSILTTQENVEPILWVMKQEFSRVGLRPTISVKPA